MSIHKRANQGCSESLGIGTDMPPVIDGYRLGMVQCATASGCLGYDLTVDLEQRRDRRVMVSIAKPGECLLEKGLQ
jgi:hypothetical protein